MHVHLLNLWRRSNSFNLILQLIWCHSFAAWLTTFVKEWGVSKSLTLVQQQQKVSAILSSLLWVSVLQRQIHVLWSLPIKISHKSGAKLSSIIIMAVMCLMYMTQSIYHLHEHSHTNNWTLYLHVSLLSHIFIDQGVSLLIFFLPLFFKSFISMFLKLVKSIRYMCTHTCMLVHGKVGSQIEHWQPRSKMYFLIPRGAANSHPVDPDIHNCSLNQAHKTCCSQSALGCCCMGECSSGWTFSACHQYSD